MIRGNDIQNGQPSTNTRTVQLNKIYCPSSTILWTDNQRNGLEKLKLNNAKGAINNSYYEYFTNDSEIVLFSHYSLPSMFPQCTIAGNCHLESSSIQDWVRTESEPRIGTQSEASCYLTAYVRNWIDQCCYIYKE